MPENKDCYETVAVLNFFGFPFDVEEDNFRGQVRAEFGFSKDDQYPLLYIDSASEEMPSCELVEKEGILSHLANIKLIGNYKQYSAYEKVGLTFCESDFEPALDDIFRNFLPIF